MDVILNIQAMIHPSVVWQTFTGYQEGCVISVEQHNVREIETF
jgi:hypothetical protein